MKTKLRVGVIGAGRIGNIHAANLANQIANAEISVISDPNLAAAEQMADRFKVVDFVADHKELLANDEVDAVAICSASPTHPAIIKDAAAAGKHIFCEKPIGFELEEIDEVLAAVDASGVKLQVGFNRRFDRNFRRARDRVVSGDIGRPHVLRITSRDPEAPPPGYLVGWGGIFKETTIHDFDMARFVIDSEVEKIYVAGGALGYPEFAASNDLDTVVITLHFANGALGTIDNGYQAVYGYDQRLEVYGSKGTVWVENERSDTHLFACAEGVQQARPPYFFLERYLDSYRAEMQAFVDCVLNDTPPPVTGRDGRIPIVLSIAAQKSYDEGRPVEISEVE
ncbi:MAG: inositol 2-dehydrogenase [Chloroflexota bacterium]|nr:inositol 2-dehydrogenase [Chloroflexota bacterium]